MEIPQSTTAFPTSELCPLYATASDTFAACAVPGLGLGPGGDGAPQPAALPRPRRFSQNAVAQLWYFTKCIDFALSTYQTRCGSPDPQPHNFLCKKYNHRNLFLFQG